ncbi:MAG: ClpXP protease specificity-enhancing factor [Burkholderiales bacterium]|nr:MAG: ClpXP protease specificity-enhancing factor [Burkholderiales bacterium]
MPEIPTKPYLIRALYEWCADNGYRPYIAVVVDERTLVPREFVRNGEIVLNISAAATNRLAIGNELLEFEARFGGVAREVSIPIQNVSAIFAQENGHGMAFEVPKALALPPEGAGEGAGADAGAAGTEDAGTDAAALPAEAEPSNEGALPRARRLRAARASGRSWPRCRARASRLRDPRDARRGSRRCLRRKRPPRVRRRSGSPRRARRPTARAATIRGRRRPRPASRI